METNLKARTLGAVLTILAVALILPNILHRQKDEKLPTEIPTKPDTPNWVEEQDYTRVRIDLNDLQSGETITHITAPEVRSIEEDEPEVASIPSNQAGLDDRGSVVAWALQMGAFGDANNAIKYRDQLREKGFKAYVLKNAATKLDHVYVGPMMQRSKAEQARERLMDELGVKGIRLQQYKPE